MKRLFLLLMTLLPAAALAQSPTPTPAETATATSTATPRPAKSPSPKASPSPSPVSTPSESLRRSQSIVDSLAREVQHRVREARGIFDRGHFDSDLKPKIGKTMDRAIARVELEQKRVEESLARLEAGEPDALEYLADELEEMAEDAVEEARSIADVLTRGGETEDNLQRIASEIRAIGEKAEELSEEVEEMVENEHNDVIVRYGHGHDYGGEDDIVRYGSGITVEKGETVKDAVAFGGNVTVHGTVDGDAVAMGGDVKVSSTGRVAGDAVAVGGRVNVEAGGIVEGESQSVGASALSRGIIPHFGHREVQRSWPAILGGRMVWAGVQFMVFFLLGMLVLAAIPERTEQLARVIEQTPIKTGGFGVLFMIALVMILVLLCITVIGIPLAFLVWLAAMAGMFLGYVALASVMGRRLKTGIVPTPLAVFAIGAAILAAVNLLPVPVKILVWMIGACFALGAVVLTRFGNPPDGTPPKAPPSGPEPVTP